MGGTVESSSRINATATGIAGDLDGDGVVGIQDFLELLASWGPCPPGGCPADFDGNGAVDIIDFLTLLSNWSS